MVGVKSSFIISVQIKKKFFFTFKSFDFYIFKNIFVRQKSFYIIK